MLYLVSRTKTHNQANDQSHKADISSSPSNILKQQFLSDFKELSTDLYSFYAHDSRHNLKCSMLIDVQEILARKGNTHLDEDTLVPMMVGDCPSIDKELLLEKAFGNESIQEVLLTRFYLQILEALFIFNNEINTYGLILTFNDNNLSIIEIYRQFILSESRELTDKGEQTKAILKTCPQAYAVLIDYMKKINQDFRQTLWRKQWGNPSIREYLKAHALTEL